MRWESELVRWVQGAVGRWWTLDATMRAGARWGSYAEIALWLSLLARGGQRRTAGAAWSRTALALGVASALVLALRTLAPRARPFVAGDAVALVPREPGPSFPSRHVASAVAMAICVRAASPRRALLMAALAALMAASRVYCGLHYPSDVLAGAALGSLAARLAWVGTGGAADSGR